jgi:hypothetical protein
MDLLSAEAQPRVLIQSSKQTKIAVAESTQVCYTHLTRGVRSRHRLLCAFEGAIVVDTSAITTYTASLMSA